MSETLMARGQDRPQETVLERNGRRVVTMDSARSVDARNTDRDVVVHASFSGVLPARMVAIHRPRAVIGHDACVGKNGSGISGLWYLEALGIPAAVADGMTADLGNGDDVYRSGIVSHVNYVAETCGVTPGMSVREAAALLLDRDPTDPEVGNKVRREIVETHPSGRRVVVTDAVVWAYPEDERTSVIVSAGHTGRSGARFVIEANPWGFICHDGGMGKNRSGISGLRMADDVGLAGACIDGTTAPVGDAFLGYSEGLISAHNDAGARRGVAVGMTVKEAAHLLMVGED